MEFALGNNWYLSAKDYKDELTVHIREYKVFGTKKYPTKNGVVFPPSRFASLPVRSSG
jgi:hypothetical protein